MPETYRQALLRAQSLLEKEKIENAKAESLFLLSGVSGLSASDLRFRYGDAISEEICAKYFHAVKRRLDGEPLQYILGEWDFLDYTFTVREGVLIPRPETEFLPQKAVELIAPNGLVYDLCAGTGCIGLSIAMMRPDVRVVLVDKFEKPLECIRQNIERYQIPNATVLEMDLLREFPDEETHPDVIVSNPPYICSAELPSLQREVQREPMEALDGGADGYIFYHMLKERWYPCLKSGGAMLMECGEGQPQTIAGLFPAKTETDKDIFGTERFVTVYKP